MAQLVEDAHDLRVEMTRLERIGSFHASFAVPLSSVIGVRASTDAWKELRGMRAPGTGIPGVIMLGTCRGAFGKDFCVVRGHGPGVVIDLTGSEFARLVISDAQAPITAERLRRLLVNGGDGLSPSAD
jgi:hypothetical protein